MSEVVVDSSKGEMFDLTEYYMSLQVTKDLPRLMSVYEKLIPVLTAYQHYTVASEVLDAVLECQMLLEIQLEHFTKVKESKGRMKINVKKENS